MIIQTCTYRMTRKQLHCVGIPACINECCVSAPHLWNLVAWAVGPVDGHVVHRPRHIYAVLWLCGDRRAVALQNTTKKFTPKPQHRSGVHPCWHVSIHEHVKYHSLRWLKSKHVQVKYLHWGTLESKLVEIVHVTTQIIHRLMLCVASAWMKCIQELNRQTKIKFHEQDIAEIVEYTRKSTHLYARKSTHLYTRKSTHLYTRKSTHLYARKSTHLYARKSTHLYAYACICVGVHKEEMRVHILCHMSRPNGRHVATQHHSMYWYIVLLLVIVCYVPVLRASTHCCAPSSWPPTYLPAHTANIIPVCFKSACRPHTHVSDEHSPQWDRSRRAG